MARLIFFVPSNPIHHPSPKDNQSTRDSTHKTLLGQPYTLWDYRRKFPPPGCGGVRLPINKPYGAAPHDGPGPNPGAWKLFRKATLASCYPPGDPGPELRPRVELHPGTDIVIAQP